MNRLIGLGEARIGIILWFQHQPCGEVDIILHPYRVQAFKCDVNYQNYCGDINSTNVCHAEGRVWSRHHVLRPLLTLHRVGPRRPCIITWPIWTYRGHVFAFHKFHKCLQYTMHCQQRAFCRPRQLLKKEDHCILDKLVALRKVIKWRNSVT